MFVIAAIGLLVAVLAGLANASMRRLLVAAGLGLIIAFVAFPTSEVVGFLSRETIHPTPLGLLPFAPILAIVGLAGVAALVAAHRGGRLAGGVGIGGGLAALATMLLWQGRGADVGRIIPLYGLMEAVTGLMVAALVVLFAWGRPNWRLPAVVVALLLGGGLFGWLISPSGHHTFPNTEGYYKLLRTTPAGTGAEIVANFNAGLEATNAQRKTLGLTPLEPLASVEALEGQRLPREAADAGFRLVQPGHRGYGSGVIFLFAGLMLGSGLMLAWRPRLQSVTGDLTGGIMLAAVVSALAPAFASTDFSFNRLAAGWPFLVNFLDRSWPPELGALQDVASQMLITVEIALVGTFLAAIFAVPMSFLAARNLTSGNPMMRLTFALMRGFFNLDRGVDTLILALVFVAAVGLGPFAGVLAMAIHSIADLGKLYSEAIENVDRGPIEALEAVGASGTNVVRWAILPQVAPLFVSYTLYRFEINFRVSIVLGLVGAGGIGFFIQEKMGTGSYDQMVVAIIAIVIVVNIIDFASSWLRQRIT